MIAENPSDPNNLVAGGLYQAPSAYNSSVYYSSGVSGVSTSLDGGRTWSTQVLPASPMWTNLSSPQCGHIHLADTAIGFGPNDTVYYIDLSYYAPGPSLSCSGPLASIGLYATISHDGGLSWDTPVGVAGMAAGGAIDKPWVAVDRIAGYSYVAYTDNGNGSQIYAQRSTDLGRHWSKSQDISSSAGLTDPMIGVELAVDPWGGVDATWIDESTSQIFFSKSTDHGGNFSTAKVLATASAFSASPAPDAFRAFTLPGFTVGAKPSTGSAARLFEVWQNGSGGSAGTPSISFSYSADNGTTWSKPIQVNSNTKLEDYQPDVATTSDGTVFVDWYGENATTGAYRLFGSVSRDGGAHFDPQITISDSDSLPQFASSGGGNAWWIGDYTDIEGGARGAWTLWTDARSKLAWPCSPCLWGYDYNITFYAALLTNATFQSNVPVNLTLNGTVPGSRTLSLQGAPAYRDWVAGEEYNLTAPMAVSRGSTESYFALWYGTAISTNATISGLVQGPSRFISCYVATRGSPCRAPGAPGHLAIHALPVNASVTVNDSPVSLDANGRAVLWEYPGTYLIHVASPRHYEQNWTVVILAGNTTWANLSLRWIPGFLVGHASPAGATVTVTPQGNVTTLLSGTFNATLNPGNYTVTAKLDRYATVSANVSIVMLETARVNLTLPPLSGWINGTVSPVKARVTLNGAAITVAGNGRFSLVRPPGIYYLNASAQGHRSQSSGAITLGPFGAQTVDLWLPFTSGLVIGNVSNPGARVWINASLVGLVNGNFNVRLMPGPYEVDVTAPTFEPWRSVVEVQENTTSYVHIALIPAQGWIEATANAPGARTVITAPSFVFRTVAAFNISVPPGTYVLNTTAPGFLPGLITVQVLPARGLHLLINLTRVPSQSSSPILWLIPTSAAVLVLGIAAVVLRLRGRSRRSAIKPAPPSGNEGLAIPKPRARRRR